MLVGMIPFVGAVGATVLIFIAFFLACISFLFLIACAWICARPWLAILIFGFIAILIITGKQVENKLKADGYITDVPAKRLYTSKFFGMSENTQKLTDSNVSNKFLGNKSFF